MDDETFKKRAEDENGQSISVGGSGDSEYARGFQAGMVQSRNYIADEEVMPSEITFANGRIVRIAGDVHGYFLTVEDVSK